MKQTGAFAMISLCVIAALVTKFTSIWGDLGTYERGFQWREYQLCN